MTLDHVAVVVPSIAAALPRWERLFGYRPATAIVTNTRQRVRVVFLRKEGSTTVKLVEPTAPTSPVWALARRGGGLHHLGFRCADVGAELERLRALGLHVLAGPEPGEAFRDHPIAFVYAGDGLNVELFDTDERASALAHEEAGAPAGGGPGAGSDPVGWPPATR